MLCKFAMALIAFCLPIDLSNTVKLEPYKPALTAEFELMLAACNQLSARRCQDEARQCLETCKEPGALAQRCRDNCAWKARSCATMSGC